ncbi:hypothetical protein FQZ97_1278950 [compost metagenome]
MQVLIGFNQLAAELEERDIPLPDARQRITIGLYFYTEPNPPEVPDDSTTASSP